VQRTVWCGNRRRRGARWEVHCIVRTRDVSLHCVACHIERWIGFCPAYSVKYVPAGVEFDVNGEVGHVDIDGKIAIRVVAFSCIALSIVEFACAT
jgi:hypothetical protein